MLSQQVEHININNSHAEQQHFFTCLFSSSLLSQAASSLLLHPQITVCSRMFSHFPIAPKDLCLIIYFWGSLQHFFTLTNLPGSLQDAFLCCKPQVSHTPHSFLCKCQRHPSCFQAFLPLWPSICSSSHYSYYLFSPGNQPPMVCTSHLSLCKLESAITVPEGEVQGLVVIGGNVFTGLFLNPYKFLYC